MVCSQECRSKKIKRRSFQHYHEMSPEQRKDHGKKVSKQNKQRRALRNGTLQKICIECGTPFHPANDRFDICSEKCRADRRKRGGREKAKVPAFKTRRNAFLREKTKRDPEFRLRNIVSKTIWRALRKNRAQKCGSIARYLPYSIPQLKAHLESFFDNQNGFTWENYGRKWQVDHVVPQSLFHYSNMDSTAFRDCWRLSNLVPMKKPENIQKGNRRIGFFDKSGQGHFLAPIKSADTQKARAGR